MLSQIKGEKYKKNSRCFSKIRTNFKKTSRIFFVNMQTNLVLSEGMFFGTYFCSELLIDSI